MHLSNVELSEQENFGAECFANERNESDRETHERLMAEKNSTGRDQHWVSERAAEAEHNDRQRAAREAHSGDAPFAFEAYVPGLPFELDATPFEPRSTEVLARVAFNEILMLYANRVHAQTLERFARSVMELPHDARADRIADLG